MNLSVKSVNARIAEELAVAEGQVDAAVRLLDEGATVPFIARYRKEVTGSLDDEQLRTLEERLRYLRELDQRRDAVLASIGEQGKLTDELKAALMAAETKSRVEDIYLPYKPKRRTKAQIAREAGLEPLAERLLADPTLNPDEVATEFLGEEVADVAAALEGARHILVERVSEDAELVGAVREKFWSDGALTTKPWSEEAAKSPAAQKFRDYFEYSEPLEQMPSHRVLAVLRGEKEEALSLNFDGGDDTLYQAMIAQSLGVNMGAGEAATPWLTATVGWAWRTKLNFSAAVDARIRLRQRAEEDAVAVFAKNLKDLLLAAPAGTRSTLGLDPGFRTGVKVAVVDGTGKVVDTCAIFPHQPQNKWNDAKATLAALVARHNVELIAIGNGTASRETDALATELIADLKAAGAAGPKQLPTKAMVSEAGASVYSASAYASHELPELDVTLRGAVSIARRLQDPLAELVKIEPKSIGVGQYQHDVTPGTLARSLDAVVEDAVNAVGVDLNTASVPLLAKVSGVTESLAESIVAHRDKTGPFRSRGGLLDVPRLGPKAFEQCAGFLRIREGDDPLDASGVHPEAYPVVRRILDRAGVTLAELIGDERKLRSLAPGDFADERFGIPTVTDILGELEKPGRDPRPAFSTATFAAGVEKVSDLKVGMVLEGVVTNVAAFGAFVDVGVHQDGLVHVSAMADRFVSDPHEVVKSGQVVRVKVLEVDVERQRIGLTLRLNDDPQRARDGKRPDQGAGPRRDGGQSRGGNGNGNGGGNGGGNGAGQNRGQNQDRGRQQRGNGGGRRDAAPAGSMADALRKAGFGK
ncbi:RNA-binding transcriptional accessory protein [Mycobacterium sp. CBMA293]|uniref:Tex family protein n=2 Tax=Mycolicibacterium TaxID=1866885 RepID=UPI00132273BD|nr:MULTISPECIES: Tex family protein [unclassified Mycolicibacterium]MUL48727.1 RNA-binding transcriptional accessory protein [Mycolicibacterium sp. CBMA 360]MUL93597.1 RNA-binding transcriptional accessory protein [Mycolicibacterium sp. CBMA 230]MUL62181.1 RNA-binding transcriptional accessory protein [Mycolicibacterium sp. CBMA 335]MUL71642.1 RNA-binding transcriptional accessory protein [Mycolicibacterium sp. CBMA 311]MUM09277.1 RNA-binding transcriptional accessory protein [Mycolicibacteriu